jgi:TonB family protein
MINKSEVVAIFYFVITLLMMSCGRTEQRQATEQQATVYQQPDYPTDSSNSIEQMPSYIGGTDSLESFIRQTLNYPQWEKNNRIEGRVIASFTIDTTGKLINPEIIRSVPGSKNFDKEVMRVLSLMPDWIPGEENGKKTALRFTLPFEFKR